MGGTRSIIIEIRVSRVIMKVRLVRIEIRTFLNVVIISKVEIDVMLFYIIFSNKAIINVTENEIKKECENQVKREETMKEGNWRDDGWVEGRVDFDVCDDEDDENEEQGIHATKAGQP